MASDSLKAFSSGKTLALPYLEKALQDVIETKTTSNVQNTVSMSNTQGSVVDIIDHQNLNKQEALHS